MTAQADEPHVGLIVEGPGDLNAIPVLLRIINSRDGYNFDCLGKPIPLNGRSNAVKKGGIEGYAATAAGRSGARGVLIVLDRDRENDPVEFTEELLSRAQTMTSKPVRLILADPDYEQWLYCSAESLGIDELEYSPGRRGLNEIRKAMQPTKYVKPVWQPKLTSRLDVDLASARSVGFTDLVAKFRELRDALDLK